MNKEELSHHMNKEELKEKISKDLEDHKAEKFFRVSDYVGKGDKQRYGR